MSRLTKVTDETNFTKEAHPRLSRPTQECKTLAIQLTCISSSLHSHCEKLRAAVFLFCLLSASLCSSRVLQTSTQASSTPSATSGGASYEAAPFAYFAPGDGFSSATDDNISCAPRGSIFSAAGSGIFLPLPTQTVASAADDASLLRSDGPSYAPTTSVAPCHSFLNSF